MFHLQDVGIHTMIFAVFRLVAVASGAAAGRFLKYEPGGPGVSVQTAYGVEVEVWAFCQLSRLNITGLEIFYLRPFIFACKKWVSIIRM
jgi:hypothetical protein